MKKSKLLLVSGAILLGILFWQLQQPAAQLSAPVQSETSETSVNTTKAVIETYAAKIQASDPYADCRAQSNSVPAIENELEKLLLPLLQQGNTVAELLQYDVTAAVWQGQYAATIARAKHLNGIQALKVQAPGVLDQLALRLQQELSSGPVALGRHLAAQEEFQTFVPVGMRTMLTSPSIILMQLSLKIPIDDFRQIIAGKTFYPLEIATAIQQQLSDEHILALIAQGRDLEQFPAGYFSFDDRTPQWNLADVAAANWRPVVLKSLKQQGVIPSSIEGVVTGLDYALFSQPIVLRQASKDPALKQRLQLAQQQTVDYLLAEGYWAHGRQNEQGKWRFGNNFLNAVMFPAETILPLLPADKVNEIFRSVEISPQPVPADSALANWLQQQAARESAALLMTTQCRQQKQQQLEQEALLSENDISEQLMQAREGKAAAELAVEPLHQRDPAWLSWHWRMGGAAELHGSEPVREQLYPLLNDPAEMQLFLQKTALDTSTTAWLLMKMINKPALLPLFTQRYAPVAPDFLVPLFTQHDTAQLQALAQAGYDFALQDRHGRNLYLDAFRHSPQAVLFLLQQGVHPLSQQLGPDALDLALEFSYRQQELHPALPEILGQVTDLEPSHLARLKRLEMYRPALYQAVLKLKPDLTLPADVSANALLTPLSR